MAQVTSAPTRTTTSKAKTVPRVRSPAGGRDLRKGEATRERLISIAEAAVLAKGFAATSIDELIAEAGLTKSGFFYHFRDKNELARAMVQRSMAADEAVFNEVFGRGRELSDDPLQAFLIGLKLLADLMSDLPGGHPGCLIASICYQERQFDRELRDANRRWLESWNARFLGYLRDIAATYPLREPVRLEDLANMLSSVLEGAIILGKVLGEPREIERQILTYRSMVKVLFGPA
jgi:TetR/AcrR family transcriptional repressor of nem operon